MKGLRARARLNRRGPSRASCSSSLVILGLTRRSWLRVASCNQQGWHGLTWLWTREIVRVEEESRLRLRCRRSTRYLLTLHLKTEERVRPTRVCDLSLLQSPMRSPPTAFPVSSSTGMSRRLLQGLGMRGSSEGGVKKAWHECWPLAQQNAW